MPVHFKAIFQSPLYGALARRVVLPWALQGLQPAGDGLEIGCGSGAMAARLLAKFPDLRLVATDDDPDMVAKALGNLGRFGARAGAQRADAAELPFDEGRFDVVFAFAMFHHVGEWKRAVSEAVRVLCPGGRLVGYDVLDGAPLHRGPGHRHESAEGSRHRHIADLDSTGRMIRSGRQLELHFSDLPLTDVRVRTSRGGLTIRFLASKATQRTGPRV